MEWEGPATIDVPESNTILHPALVSAQMFKGCPPTRMSSRTVLNWFVRGQDTEDIASGVSEERWASGEVGERGEKGEE